MKKFSFFSVLLVLLVIISSTLSYAQNSLKPPVNVTVAQIDNTNGVRVKFQQDTGGQKAMYFYVYVSPGKTTDLTQFKVMGKASLYNGTTDLFADIGGLQNGDYSFYVTALNYDNNQILESQPSEIVFFNVKFQQNDPVFVSQPPMTGAVGKQYIYDIKVNYSIIDTCTFDIVLINGPKDMILEPNAWILNWTPTAKGNYEVELDAFGCDKNKPIAIQKFVITVEDQNTGSYVKITSKPNPVGFINQEYIYQVVAQSNVNCPVKFEFQGQLPPGAYFDNNSGILKVLVNAPTAIGGAIKAFLDCDNTIFDMQQFSIQFGDNPNDAVCTTIYGTANFDNNTPVPDGIVNAWRLTQKSNIQPLYKGVIQNGYYKIPVPEGTYILEFDGTIVVHTYYNNAPTTDKAQKIDVVCGVATQIDVTLKQRPAPNFYNVSGRVLRASTNSPAFALVQFYPVELNNNKNNGQPTQIFSTQTDINGYYNIKLSDEFTYQANAICAMNSIYLMQQWFDGVDTQLDADILYLINDLTDINFNLKDGTPQNNNNITGKVIDEKNNSVQANITAIMVNPAANTNTKQRFSTMVQTIQDGSFSFPKLPFGDYVLLSVPIDRMYVPGYYKANAIATLKWKDASRIGVSDTKPDITFEIKHGLRKGYKGIIQVGGTISAIGGTLKNNDKPLSTNEIISGAFVYVVDENGEISDYTFTDANGKFLLSEIANGNNKLFVDKVGYETMEQSLTSDNNKSMNQEINLMLNPDESLGVDDFTISKFSAYPTPATNNLTIEYNGLQGMSCISIFNIIGLEVTKQNIESVDGMNTNIINLNNLPAGIYVMKVTNAGLSKTIRFNIVR